MRATQSVDDHGSRPREGKRHRRIGITMLVAGVIVLVAAFAPASANAVIPNSSLVPSGQASFNLSCTGNNDPTTDTILAGTVGDPVVLPATITADAIPSPSDGEQFSLDFTWHITLPFSLVNLAIAFTPDLTQQNGTLPIHADSGATGADAVGMPPPTDVSLGDGSKAITYDQGPFTGTFTRSGTGPVQFSPGVTTTDSVTPAATLHLICTPTGVMPLTLADQAGPPPSTTTTTTTTPPTRPTTRTTAPPGGGTSPASGTGGTSTSPGPVTTRSTGLARTGFHPELLYIGIALLGAGFALSMTGRRFARAAARSR